MFLRILVVPALHLDESQKQVGFGIARVEVEGLAQMFNGGGRLTFIPEAGGELKLPERALAIRRPRRRRRCTPHR